MDKPKPHRIPCKHPFSNGTEFEMFLENCYGCFRYRNGKCRIVNACYRAMFDLKHFPYDDLMDWSDGYGGKACKHYTQEPIRRNHKPKQCEGQETLWQKMQKAPTQNRS